MISLDLLAVNRHLQSKDARKRISYFHQLFRDELVMTTSFGGESQIMLDLVTQVVPDVPVIYIDHGCWIDPNLQREFVDVSRDRFKLNLITVQPRRRIVYNEVYEAFAGNSNGLNDELINSLRRDAKKEPVDRILKALGAQAWMAGVSRDESETREGFDFLMMNGKGYKVHPILDWTRQMRMDYIAERKLQVNPNYTDIFKGLDGKSECGLHVDSKGADI